MKKINLTRWALIAPVMLLFVTVGYSQSYSYKISGVVVDSAQTPMPSATVYMESAKDSTVVNYTITNMDGKFILEGKTRQDKVYFFIAYTGFQKYHKDFSLKTKPTIDLGTVVMKQQNNTLGEVVVQGTPPPIKFKKDTLEFNVSSFKTKENATLEDLLKKLPGVTVDNDGTIKVNGKEVNKIKVNGKDFFGGDPKIAIKNLPKELLQKIQVVDSKTKSEEFTGKESSSNNKTINVTIKKEDNKGLFARMTAGAGTDHRFSLNGIGNYFNQDMRISVLGSANNINSVGFSFDEIYDAMGRNAFTVVRGLGGFGNFFGGSGGITKSTSGGFDFTDDWGDITDFSASYFYNRASTHTESKVRRENILPDRQYTNTSHSIGKNVNNNHRGNVRFEYEPDTLTRISIHPNITANNGYSDNNSSTHSFQMDGTEINNSTSQRRTKVTGIDFSNDIDFTRKYGHKGGFYKVSFTNDNRNERNKRFNFTSRNIFDDAGNLTDNKIQDQFIDEKDESNNYTVDAQARIPLTKKWMLDLDYSFEIAHDHNRRLFYNRDSLADTYTLLNEDLSSNFKVRTLHQKPNLGIVYRGDKITSGLSGGLDRVRLKNEEQFTGAKIDNTYNNLFARFYMRYHISRMKSIYLNYRTSQSTPSATQLLPVSNKTNPLNIITGNPDLKPTFSNNFRAGYHNYNFQKKFGFGFYLGGNYNANQVVAKTTTDEDLVRTTTYTNVDGRYSYYAGSRVHKRYKFDNKSSLRPSIRVRLSASKDIGFSNGVKYHSNNYSVGPRFKLTYDIPDIITIAPSYRISYNNTKYSLNNQRDQDYTNHDVRLQITSYWPKNVIFGSDITYTHVGQTAPGFDNNYYLWNLSLGYKIWDGDGIFKVKVFDVLDQNVSTSRFTGQDYIQDTQQLVLQRYMMFSFTYKLSKFGGKKKPSGHMRMIRY